jgi:cellulose synthase/poly-beta-1,6-N-acetylglucosamine synthase-like glycosyltransferase
MLAGLIFTAVIVAITINFISLSRNFDRRLKSTRLPVLEKFPMVSVIVPAYKSEKKIGETLDAVNASGYPNLEVIVVNDSDDQTPEIASSRGAEVIQNPGRMGKAMALNKAAAQAQGDFFLFIDSDTTLQKYTLQKLLMSYNYYTGRGEKVGIVAPKYMAHNMKNVFSRFTDIEQKLHQSILKVQMNLGSILSIRGCCLLVPRQAFLDSGGFSNTLLEDGDFTAKVFKAGYKIKYEPRASVMTAEPETFQDFFRAKVRYGKGTYFCAQNHRRPYAISLQSAICFYPYFLLFLALAGYFLFNTPFLTYPFTMLMASLAAHTAAELLAFSLLALIVPILGQFGYTALANAREITSLQTFAFFALLLIPVAFAAYMKGTFCGITERIRGMPELQFRDW